MEYIHNLIVGLHNYKDNHILLEYLKTQRYFLQMSLDDDNSLPPPVLDSQFYNPHLVQFGAYEVFDEDYQKKLKIALTKKRDFPTKITYSESLLILQSLTQIS